MENISSWKKEVLVDSYLNGLRSAIPYANDQLKIMLRLLSNTNRQIKKFIDIGSGDGLLSQLILEQNEGSLGYLIDFSLPMIEAGKTRLKNYAQRIVFVNSDISKSDWQKEIFSDEMTTVDAFVSGYCIHHLTHGRKYELYEEIYHRLSSGGIFINIEHVASTSVWGEKVHDELLIDSLYDYEQKLVNPRTLEQIANNYYNREDKKDNILLSVETQVNWLREIGFKNVDIYFKCFEFTVFAGIKV
jgi:SAM-dependent methyltransferase